MFRKFRNTQQTKLPINIKTKEMQKKHGQLMILNLLDNCTQIMKEDRITLRNLIKQNNLEVIDLLQKHLKNTDMHLLQTQIRRLLNKLKGKNFQVEPSIFAQINDFNKIAKQPLAENIQQLNQIKQITQDKQQKKQLIKNQDQENQYQYHNNQNYQQNNCQQQNQFIPQISQKCQQNYYNQDRIKELTIEDQEDYEIDQNKQNSNSKQNSSFQSNENQLNKSLDNYQIQQNEFNEDQEKNDSQFQQQQNYQENFKQYSNSKSQQCIKNSSNKKPQYDLNDFRISDFQNTEKNQGFRNIKQSLSEQYEIQVQNTGSNSSNIFKNFQDNQFSKSIQDSKNQKPASEIQSNLQHQYYYNDNNNDNHQYETASEQINKFNIYQQQNNELSSKTYNIPFNYRQQIGKTESYKQLLSNNGLIQNKEQQLNFQPSTFQIYDFLLKTDTKTVYNSPRNNPKNQQDIGQDIMNLDWQDQQDNDNFIYQNVKTVDSQQLYQKPIEENIQITINPEVEYLKKALFLENLYLEDIFDEIFIDYKLSKISKVFFRLKMDQAIKDLRNDSKLNINESDLNRFFDFCDTKHDNFLDINEFGPALRNFCNHKSENENLVYQVFEFLDGQKNGFISQNDLFFQLQQLNIIAKQRIKDYDDKNYDPQLISEKVFEEIDIKKKGILTYFDFYLQKNSYFYKKIEVLFEIANKRSIK